MKELAHMNKYLLKYKWYLISGIVFTVISNLFGVIPAQVVRHALDLVKENIDIYFLYDGLSIQNDMYAVFAYSLSVYGGLILVMAILKGVFLFLVRQTIIVMSRHIEFDMKNEIFSHYQTLPLSFYRRNSTGDLMARVSEDVGKVRMYYGPSIMYLINMLTLVVMILSYMFSVNARLTWWVLLPMPILSLSIFFVSSKMNQRSMMIQKSLSRLSTFVQEAFSGIRILKAFSREENSLQRFTEESNTYRDKQLALTQVDALFFPVVTFLIGLSTVICVFVGGQEVINGALTPGNITEFIMYVYMLTWPLIALGWTTSQIQQAAASQARINEFLAVKNDILSEKNLVKPISGSIAFEHVGFTYPDSGIKAIKDFSLQVHPGETVAILGTTGSGKSTLANLLLRMYDTEKGRILIDGEDIRDYDVQYLRSQFGYVPQDVFLFSDSIRNNIKFGSPGLSEEAMQQAAKDADLYQNILGFEKGFDTEVGERGVTLSGGQKQRLSIARAIVREPKILILDDCLSAVDTNTENIILQNLERIMAARTSVIISHRVSSAKLADKIVVLDDGQIVEEGTHDILMAQNGVYKELYDKQMSMEEA
ncbi:ABC transporter ATP-binding protein/permease [Marinilongibacter aquaticus]|uniref:ABC transporter ATP-binding protein n=1 Tax=Marinilongibacter aquaticus TaxID=2975157 RepID=UPI0021BD4198|nr:ABC transporter ATP-binding protein [Marinilongibacter aquaticus]UBM59910.1 ABC transporter ATP-binding protein/permease [Marinilongibacter aquaticus]